MQIRPARTNDLAAIAVLLEEVDALHRERVPERFRATAGPARPHDYLHAAIEGPASAILLVDGAGDGDLLGLVHLELRDTPALPLFVPRRFAIVDDLVVAARARRQGIGRALMTAADGWARGHGATTIELTVYTRNAEAAAFYRALGYAALSSRLSRDVV